jgi:hypothetical protein
VSKGSVAAPSADSTLSHIEHIPLIPEPCGSRCSHLFILQSALPECPGPSWGSPLNVVATQSLLADLCEPHTVGSRKAGNSSPSCFQFCTEMPKHIFKIQRSHLNIG